MLECHYHCICTLRPAIPSSLRLLINLNNCRQPPQTACRVTLEGALARSAIVVTGLSPIPHKVVPVICSLWFYLEQKTLPSSVYVLMPTQTESAMQGGCELMHTGLHCRLHSREWCTGSRIQKLQRQVGMNVISTSKSRSVSFCMVPNFAGKYYKIIAKMGE